MPVVKQKSVHVTPGKCIAYILNGDKNSEMKYATGINTETDIDLANELFKLSFETNTNLKYNLPGKDKNKTKERIRLHHYMQSFDPKEENITPELVHKIGIEWAKKCFGKDRHIIVSAHIDKTHIHNHFAVASYDLNGNIWTSSEKSLASVRKTSDKICLGYDLSIIKNPKGKGDYGTRFKDNEVENAPGAKEKVKRSPKSLTYKEWEAINKGVSWKEKIRVKIDYLIKDEFVKTIKDIKDRLMKDGYIITRDGNSKIYGRYFTIRPVGEKNGVRNYKLGDDYTTENIEYRIKNRKSEQSQPITIIKYKGIQQEYFSCLQKVIAVVDEKISYHRKKYSVVDVKEMQAVLDFMIDNDIDEQNKFEIKFDELSYSYDKLTDELFDMKEEMTKLENNIEDYKIYQELSAKIPTDGFNTKQIFTADELEALKKTEYTYKLKPDDIKKFQDRIDILTMNFSQTQSKTETVRNEKEKAESMLEKYQSHISFDYQSILAEVRAEESERKAKTKTEPTKQLNEEKRIDVGVGEKVFKDIDIEER
ncbi:MAG: relaxase/mobilization nuclease domain-containing protein [Oscillospiraceae bacterium]|nr:relaxase/mobilization nuclease domain-containing protein [Oscillospiraceae bacterium]